LGKHPWATQLYHVPWIPACAGMTGQIRYALVMPPSIVMVWPVM
jgi:hypothetical protein